MNYLFDSDVCVELLRARNAEFVKTARMKFGDFTTLRFYTSAVVVGELLVGVEESPNPRSERTRVDKLVSRFSVLSFDSAVAEQYAKIRAKLEKEGNVIGSNDMMIGATAIHYELVLVTRNVREFSRIEGLRVESVI